MGDGVNIAARLEGIAKPNSICLSEDAYRQVRVRLDLAVNDLGPIQLKNIAEPIRAYLLEVGGPVPAKAAAGSPQISAPSTAPRLSIIVLPFTNIGGDPEQEYFVDGVTESLTTDLSHIAGSFVIARNTAFTYKGKPFDVKRIGHELNVRYVLEGSVQRGGNRMRVNVQLIDAETGNHLWAERFDKPLADLFDMQDEIVARLARQLDAELVAAEARRAERATDPDAMDLYFQGTACWHKGQSPEILSQARGYFERALERDPGNVEALVGAAWTDAMRGTELTSDDRAQRLAAAETAATKILSLAPNHAFTHFVLGYVQIFTNRVTEGIAEAERALALDRNLAIAHAITGTAKTFAGRAEESEAHIQEALRLSPRDSRAYEWMASLAATKLNLGADAEAAQWARRSIEANRNLPLVHFWLAAALAQLGRLDQARQAIQPGLALAPGLTIARYRAGVQTDHPTYLAQREHIIEGLRKAGVPEG
jgi:TolB-like protein